MKKWSKRIISMLLCCLMTVSLAACGGSKDDVANNEEAKKYVFRMEELEGDCMEENPNIIKVNYANDRIYMLTSKYYWDEMTGMVIKLVSFNMEGEEAETVELLSTLKENPDWYAGDGEEDSEGDSEIDVMPLEASAVAIAETAVPVETVTAEEDADTEEDAGAATEESGNITMEDNMWVSSAYMDDDGVYLIMERSSYGFDEMGNYVEGEATLELYAYDLNGELHNRIMVNEDQNNNYMWVNGFLSDAEGNLVINLGDCVRILNTEGKVLNEIDTSTEGYVQSMFLGKDGDLKMIAYNNEWTKMFLKSYDLKTGQPGEEVELPDFLTNYNASAGVAYDLLLTSSSGLFGYNIGDEAVTQVLSYINSDIDGTNVDTMYEIDDKTLLCSYYDDETYDTKLAVCHYVDPADIPDKEVISLACHYMDYYLRKRIVEFNKESENYRIIVKDYSQYDTPEDYNAGITRLNNDIVTGQIPDILALDSDMPIEVYAAKGILADIGKMIEDDEELQMDDYMTNVFDAYSVKGTLYSVIPSFYVNTVMAKTADVGEESGWTIADLQALMDAHPDSSAFGEATTRENMLRAMIVYNGSRFTDRNTGKCNFDSDEFKAVLEFVAQFPEEFDWDSLGEDYWTTYETQYRDGSTLLMTVSINDFSDYTYNAHGYFGEPVTLIGFPAEEGNGGSIYADSQYAISAKSSHKEGAWEFVRYYLTEEYQTNEDRMSWTLPVYREALLANLEEAQERPHWEDADGNVTYYDQYFWAGDEEFVIEPLTKEEADTLYEYICSVNTVYSNDESLYNIIEEEAAAYFAGQKSVGEVVEIIQSRAQIYINESR